MNIAEFDIGMATERLLRSIFGDKNYYGKASRYTNVKVFKRDIKKVITKLKEDTDQLIASEYLIQSLIGGLNDLANDINKLDQDRSKMRIVINALYVISIFLGYHYQVVGKKSEPYFIPSTYQDRSTHQNSEQYHDFKESLSFKRAEIVKQLKLQKHTDAEVAEILNISRYKTAQLIKLSQDMEGKL